MILSCVGLMIHVKRGWKTFRKGTKEGSVQERKKEVGSLELEIHTSTTLYKILLG